MKEEKAKKPRIDTFPKLLVILIVLHGLICVTASYVLAFPHLNISIYPIPISILSD